MSLLDDLITSAYAQAAKHEADAAALQADKPVAVSERGVELKKASAAERAQALRLLERARQLREWATFAALPTAHPAGLESA